MSFAVRRSGNFSREDKNKRNLWNLDQIKKDLCSSGRKSGVLFNIYLVQQVNHAKKTFDQIYNSFICQSTITRTHELPQQQLQNYFLLVESWFLVQFLRILPFWEVGTVVSVGGFWAVCFSWLLRPLLSRFLRWIHHSCKNVPRGGCIWVPRWRIWWNSASDTIFGWIHEPWCMHNLKREFLILDISLHYILLHFEKKGIKSCSQPRRNEKSRKCKIYLLH